MYQEVISKLIDHLKHVKQRPQSFVPDSVYSYLMGIGDLSRALDLLPVYLYYQEQVTVERGWAIPPEGLPRIMKRAGLSQQGIDQELLSIEIETWEQLLIHIDSNMD